MSEPATLGSDRRFRVCIDFKDPYAWLATPPTVALEDELGITADWLPRIVPPLEAPSPPRPGDDRGTRHRRFRAEYRARDIERYAPVHGLTIRGVHRAPDSSLASIGLLWARRAGPDVRRLFVERVFRDYWAERLDLEDIGAIGEALEASGAATGSFGTFARGVGTTELNRIQERLGQVGVFDVPAYLVGDEVFLGRQHLPMIRWLLTGRRGSPPI